MSVTYGAAGSTPGHTIAVAKAVAETGVTPLCHLTCVQSTREHVQHVLADMKTAGMENVLALRGDLPKEGEPCHDFAYAAELIDFIHQQGDFCVGAACYPEGHPEIVLKGWIIKTIYALDSTQLANLDRIAFKCIND